MADLTCSRPDAVTPDDLIAYLDNAALPSASEHIRSCAYCTARVRTYAGVQRKLQSALRRFDCPSPLLLGEYHLDFLPSDERRRIAEHLVHCPRCKAEIETRRSYLADDPDPLPRLSRNPLTIIAQLLGPRLDLAQAGLRGGSDSASQTFRASNVTITVAPGPVSRPGSTSLLGLIDLGGDELTPAGREVQLARRSGATRTTSIDDLGNFFFEDVQPGIYDLKVQLEDAVIVIQDLPFGMSE